MAVLKCPAYGIGLERNVRRLLDGLGGMAHFVRAGQRVLIKPNLLSDRAPDDAVTTHPELVRMLIRLVREAGGVPSVGDSPARVAQLRRVWDVTGMAAMCAEEKAPLVNLEESGSVPVEVDGYRFSLARAVVEADAVVSVPKVKSHVLTVLTAGVKNMFGAVPGFQKAQLHRDHPSIADFGELLARICQRVRPALTVADGVVGMEGSGPSGGQPAALQLLAASADPFALDHVLCRLLQIDPRRVPYLRPGLGGTPEDLSGWPVVAELSPGVLAPRQFEAPAGLIPRLIPAPLVRPLRGLIWVRPAITDRCVTCGRCAGACPAQALVFDRARPAPPILVKSRCIGCCCCHEVCPSRAIVMRASPLLNLLSGGRLA